ncbi:MAG TPA: HNH endonuclease [Roseiarcus sp.]|nr:HNH endonuclease [Roseiarcus sp.]
MRQPDPWGAAEATAARAIPPTRRCIVCDAEYSGKAMVRLTHNGKVRRILATRAAWALAVGEWPIGGLVKPKNGNDRDLRPENLALTKFAAHQPQANAGRASSLVRRQATNEALINALAERANPSLSELGELVGLSQGRVSARLTKLAAQGLTESPGCCPNRSWMLTAKGRAAATSVVIDDTDRQFLTALAFAPQRQMQLAAEVGCCSLTVMAA